MDNSICCIRLADGKFHQAYLSINELNELNCADSSNKYAIMYIAGNYQVDKMPEDDDYKYIGIFALIRENDIETRKQRIYNRSKHGFVRAVRRHAHHGYTRDIIIFKKTEGSEYVSISNDEFIVKALSKEHSEAMHEWVCTDALNEYDSS